MRDVPKARTFTVLGILLLLSVFFVAGCGGEEVGKLVPVNGKVTLDGKALTGGIVTFMPDTGKGNKTVATATGFVDAEGNYKLESKTPKNQTPRDGAPVGWYKVKVMPGMPEGTPEKGVKMTTVPVQYMGDATPLTVEVKEGGGPYNLELKSR